MTAAPLPWRLHAIDSGVDAYGTRGKGFGTFKSACRFADRQHRTHSCRIEHARTGELWRRRGGSWIKEREPNDPDWLRQRDTSLGGSRADGRPGPSS